MQLAHGPARVWTGLALQLLQVACTCNRVHNSCRLAAVKAVKPVNSGLCRCGLDRPGADRPRSGCLFVPPPESRPQGSRGRRLARSLARKSQVMSCARLSLCRQLGKPARPPVHPRLSTCASENLGQREKTERLGEKNKDKTTAIIVLRYQRAQAHKAQETRETRARALPGNPNPNPTGTCFQKKTRQFFSS